MSKLTAREVRKYLETKSQADLVNDINEGFYSSMEGMYDSALKLITTSAFAGMFQERCHKIVTDTSGIGWGFHDELSTMYDEMYGE